MSVHNPSFYARRFQDFITKQVFKKDKSKERERERERTFVSAKNSIEGSLDHLFDLCRLIVLSR